ncbi:response regulator [Neptuniibacter sp.]|uniref:response regulator n=1 Tax=Neptuniibacter sp. TaxID=1962643 RepID=UPI00263445AC|nr:response regulator [Neptuniibacter sp.]MCP4598112.1 response regulator [Neptuniibacter sp.]
MQQTIFVVDGSSTIRTLYKAVLESVGYRVKLHQTGESCVKALNYELPNLILMGAELPDTDCVALATKIKSQPESILIPIIVISSMRSMELKRTCFQAGVTDFILKNCTQNFLVERVKNVLQRKDTMQFNQHLVGQRFNVLIAEDSVALLSLYGQMFEQMGCKPILCRDGREAWEELQKRTDIDLVLTDIEMPNMDGVELNHLIRSRSDLDQVPVIVVTRIDQQELLCELLTAGASDYISKPFSHEELQARVGSHLRTRHLYKEQQRLNRELKELNSYLEDRVRERTQELYDANVETITKLALVCDYKDNDTGNHIKRVKAYCEELGSAIGLSDEVVRRLGYSSMMHDVGKITTPDSILNKPGPLNEEEWDKMREHVEAGARVLGEKTFFNMARDIALHHHEKVDGSGYPKGLCGDEIPLAARIVAVVDVFDALVSKRSYKEAWKQEDAVVELRKISGSHLDKRLVDIFISMLEGGQLDYIRKQYPEDSDSTELTM